MLAVCAGAWGVLVVLVLAGGGGAAAPGTGAAVGLSVASPAHPHGGVLASHSGHAASPGAALLGWAAMLVAMMGPLLIPALRHVVERSLPRRRTRAVIVLLVGYLAVWSVGLLALAGASTLIRSVLVEPGSATALGLALVVAWQVSPAKQRCLNRCHARPPLAVVGRSADLDALRFGLRQAAWCFGSCWALMLVPLLLPGHHLTAMLLVAGWLWAERLESPAPLAWRPRVPLTVLRVALAQTGAGLRATSGPARPGMPAPTSPASP